MPTRDENVPIGNEYPDPHTPPTGTAPGSADLVESPEPGHGQFQEAYDAVSDEVAAVGSIKRDDDTDDDDRGDRATS